MNIDGTITKILRDIEKLKEPKKEDSIDTLDGIISPFEEFVSVEDMPPTITEGEGVGIFGTSKFGFCEFGE